MCACELKRKTEELNEKQTVFHFHGNKGALMNLNQCPAELHHNRQNLNLFFFFKTAAKLSLGHTGMSSPMMAILLANCCG